MHFLPFTFAKGRPDCTKFLYTNPEHVYNGIVSGKLSFWAIG